MTRARLSRAAAVAATAGLLVMATLAGSVSGANTRSLVIGSPPLTAPDFANNGKLIPTPVSQGGTTMFMAEVKSTDNQTLAHALLSISIATSPVGLSLNQFYDPAGGSDASSCSPSGNVISCDFGNLEAFGERTIEVVVDVASTFPTDATGLFSAAATTNNENGSNQQLFTASSEPFRVNAASANALQTFVPPGQLKHLNTAGLGPASAGNLSTSIDFKATGQGDVVAINEGTNPVGSYACPTDLLPSGVTCQPDYSEVLFSRSGFGAPYLTWTLNASVPGTYTLAKGFVVHYTSATFHDAIMYLKDKNTACGSDLDAKMAADHQCILSATLGKPDKVTGRSLLKIVAIFDHNGGHRF